MTYALSERHPDGRSWRQISQNSWTPMREITSARKFHPYSFISNIQGGQVVKSTTGNLG